MVRMRITKLSHTKKQLTTMKKRGMDKTFLFGWKQLQKQTAQLRLNPLRFNKNTSKNE